MVKNLIYLTIIRFCWSSKYTSNTVSGSYVQVLMDVIASSVLNILQKICALKMNFMK